MIPNLTLSILYDQINEALKGSGIHNTDVKIQIFDGENYLEFEKLSSEKLPKSEEEIKRASGMYPSTHTGTLTIFLRKKDEHKGS
jgi:hypothetical protein